MYQERLEDLSIYYWIKNKFTDYPFITIVDGFPDQTLVIPSISVEWEELEGMELELGNRRTIKERLFYIDVFAKNKSQRDEFAYKIYNDLDDGIPVYNYNEGFPENGVTPSRLGALRPLSRRVRKIGVDASLVDELYFRAVVILTAVYDQF